MLIVAHGISIVMNVLVMTGMVDTWVVTMRRDILEGSTETGKPILTIMTMLSPFRTRGTTRPTAYRGKFPIALNPYHQST